MPSVLDQITPSDTANCFGRRFTIEAYADEQLGRGTEYGRVEAAASAR